MSDFKAPFSQQQDVCHQIQKGGRGRLRRCVKEKISKEWIRMVDDGINDSGLLQHSYIIYCIIIYHYYIYYYIIAYYHILILLYIM